MRKYSTDWENIDLSRAVERDKYILDGYTFEQLLLEIECNLSEINEATVAEQFEKELETRIETAKEVFRSNLSNIVKYAKKGGSNERLN